MQGAFVTTEEYLRRPSAAGTDRIAAGDICQAHHIMSSFNTVKFIKEADRLLRRARTIKTLCRLNVQLLSPHSPSLAADPGNGVPPLNDRRDVHWGSVSRGVDSEGQRECICDRTQEPSCEQSLGQAHSHSPSNC